MSSPRKGRRLPVALPPRFPSRTLTLLFATVVTAVYLGPAFYFVYGRPEEHFRNMTMAFIMGILGLVCLAGWVREFLRWYLAGDTVVEISSCPVSPGQPLQCFVLQDRDHSWIRSLQARVVCRRQFNRGLFEDIVSLSIGDGTVERDGRRARVQGTVQLPADAAPSVESEPLKIRWSVEVRVVFGRTLTLIEDHPFELK